MILSNPKTGKQIIIPLKRAAEVFGQDFGNRKFICLPCDPAVAVHGREVLTLERSRPKKKLSGTCVVRMGGIGDLILMSSGLRALKQGMNGSRLTVATLKEHMALMAAMPFVDRCIAVDDLGKYKFDRMIDLRFAVEPPEFGSACKGTWDSYTMEDRSDAFDKLLGVYPAPKRFDVPVDNKVTEKMAKSLPEKFVLLAAAIAAPARSIPIQYIKRICSLVRRKLGMDVVLVGSSRKWNEELKALEGKNIINMIDKTNLQEMISLCQLSDLVVTPDTGTLHVAGALRKKTIGVFGNINPRTRISYYPTVKAIYPHGEKKCIPCWDLHPCNPKAECGPACMRVSTPSRIMEVISEG